MRINRGIHNFHAPYDVHLVSNSSIISTEPTYNHSTVTKMGDVGNRVSDAAKTNIGTAYT